MENLFFLEKPKNIDLKIGKNWILITKDNLKFLKKKKTKSILYLQKNKIYFLCDANISLLYVLLNMFSGLQNPFSIKLRLFGLGFKIKKVDNLLFFKLGHTHEIKVFLPESILFYQAKTKTNIYTFRSIDLKILSQFVSKIRELKKVEPYKGKGFRYFDEIIKKKEGKKNNV